jgi:hypothetical protein
VSTAPPPRSLARFAFEVLGFTVVLFAVWYLAARPLSAGTAWLAARMVEAPDSIDRVRVVYQPAARQVTFEVEPDHETARRHRLPADAVVDVPANPLKHTFGLPFFLALLLASRPRGIAWKAALGCVVVTVLAAVGLACEVLVLVGGMQSATGGALFAMGGRELIALGFQLGTLAFPTVVPVMLWVAMDRDHLKPYFRP